MADDFWPNYFETNYNDSGVLKKLWNTRSFESTPSGEVTEKINKDSYITYIDEAAGGLTYIGKAIPGSITPDEVWQIKLVSEGVGWTTITWADDNDDFDNVWDDRAGLVYG